jgi:hypothetical protein
MNSDDLPTKANLFSDKQKISETEKNKRSKSPIQPTVGKFD